MGVEKLRGDPFSQEGSQSQLGIYLEYYLVV